MTSSASRTGASPICSTDVWSASSGSPSGGDWPSSGLAPAWRAGDRAFERLDRFQRTPEFRIVRHVQRGNGFVEPIILKDRVHRRKLRAGGRSRHGEGGRLLSGTLLPRTLLAKDLAAAQRLPVNEHPDPLPAVRRRQAPLLSLRHMRRNDGAGGAGNRCRGWPCASYTPSNLDDELCAMPNARSLISASGRAKFPMHTAVRHHRPHRRLAQPHKRRGYSLLAMSPNSLDKDRRCLRRDLVGKALWSSYMIA